MVLHEKLAKICNNEICNVIDAFDETLKKFVKNRKILKKNNFFFSKSIIFSDLIFFLDEVKLPIVHHYHVHLGRHRPSKKIFSSFWTKIAKILPIWGRLPPIRT